jgi:hypothetical protein
MSFISFFAFLFMFSISAFAGNPAYPAGVREQHIRDCLNQPLPAIIEGKVNDRQKLANCTCMFNYMQEKVPYADYKTANDQANAGNIRDIDPKLMDHIQTATLACGQRYLLK